MLTYSSVHIYVLVLAMNFTHNEGITCYSSHGIALKIKQAYVSGGANSRVRTNSSDCYLGLHYVSNLLESILLLFLSSQLASVELGGVHFLVYMRSAEEIEVVKDDLLLFFIQP